MAEMKYTQKDISRQGEARRGADRQGTAGLGVAWLGKARDWVGLGNRPCPVD